MKVMLASKFLSALLVVAIANCSSATKSKNSIASQHSSPNVSTSQTPSIQNQLNKTTVSAQVKFNAEDPMKNMILKNRIMAGMIGLICLNACSVTGHRFLAYQVAGDRAYLNGDYEEAEKQYRAALRLAEQNGRQNPNVITALRSLATVYEDQKKDAEAEALYRDRITLADSEWRNDPKWLYMVYDDLAMFYLYRNRYEDARPLIMRAIELREMAFGPQDPEVAEGLEYYSLLLRAKGHEQEAVQMENRAKDIRSKQIPQAKPAQ